MKILTLSTYRIDNPRHGGPIRVAAIQRVLRAAGWRTRHLAVYVGNENEAPNASDILFPIDIDFHRQLKRTDGRDDVDAADFLLNDRGRYDAACLEIDDFDPDILWLEHPWLWPFIKAYLAERPQSKARVVYGAANIEARLIENIVQKLPRSARERIQKTVAETEDDLCRSAHGIVAVSTGELEHLRSYGKPAVLAANGVWPKGERGGVEYWSQELSGYSTALFVSSAHPPNAAGFVEMLGDNLAYLAPNERIVVVGSVLKLLEGPDFYENHRGLNVSRMIGAGIQDDAALNTFLDLADGVLLPIKAGGGTNLKTAEALNNRKPIVATSAAMRGFEEYSEFPGVTICDEPVAFQAAVKALLATRAKRVLDYDAEQERMLDRLLWPSTLSSLVPFLKSLMAPGIEGTRDLMLPTLAPTARAAARVHVWSQYQLRPLLERGWHDFEPSGTWSKDRIAVVRVRFAQDFKAPIHLRLALEVFNPHRRPVEIDIFTPGGMQATHRFRGTDRKRDVAVAIKEDDLDADRMTEIYFRSNALFSPISSSKSGDGRLLGFRIMSITASDTPLKASTPPNAVRAFLSGKVGGLFTRFQ